VHDWNLLALSHELTGARRDFKQRQLSQAQLVAEERYVAEMLAYLIEGAIMPASDLAQGHELTDVVREKRAWCQGCTLLYFVLGNAIGLPVRGLHVTNVARGPQAVIGTHDACLVQLVDGLTVMVDITHNLGDRALVSKSFRFDDVYQPRGSYWKLIDDSNPLALHRVVRPMGAAGLASQLYDGRAHDAAVSGDFEKAIVEVNEAIRLDPKSATAYDRRGIFYASSKDYDRSIADFSDAIGLDPDCFDTYTSRGNAFAFKGEFDKAIADYSGASRPTATTAAGKKAISTQPIRPLDVIQVFVGNPLPDRPVDGDFCLVEPDGSLFLGHGYGRVKVAGMTCEQAKVAVE
jgi:tetratricopeptide (TPR) repeat protein